jgi:hypothetical protein
LQRGKILEKYLFMKTGYLLNLDGTGYFSSDVFEFMRAVLVPGGRSRMRRSIP